MKKRLMLLATALLLLTTACGIRPSVTIYGSQGPADSPEGTILYFVNDNILTRVIRPPTDFSKDNVTTLAEGTLSVEQAEGLTTEVPSTVLPITRGIKNRTMELKLSSPVEALSEMARNQLICTALPPEEDRRTEVILTGPDKSLDPKPCPFIHNQKAAPQRPPR
jgi:hypothetical protein